ncbi:serine hydrolase domain-containing protein [Rhizobium lentis]|uniref:CubicO group peptidase (Beta-lactamase class C family) n=1 Tax=Rhizobium lentis TaxID=1138194 RepID=A0A7W8XK64_9HYPH|nr:serine hydrolase [Rhizobium lentis]MBB4577241.1 CubicO group peptidase (beta-lactamase class C family) [Rhizobium lentis]MBB5553804.1 CubicO group peptidase (beta-lactamase class C family) [Rhizobium lentis]MBB5564365.1 CubicO group peptidase (beta-lactamase class C family) [Rhizobium lentis]MBB5570835.1 CubicO group peptidase (beta-lactamase class C family) [Rhizobium lentis]
MDEQYRSQRGGLALPPRGIAYHWTPEQQIVGYRERARIEPVRVVGRGGQVRRFSLAVQQISPKWHFEGKDLSVDDYMAATRASGVIVLKDGNILLERYGLGRTAEDRWDVQSVSKSVTAILLGAAVHDGSIRSMGDLVTDYVPELKGSAYDDVTIHQLATMTSGVKWDEDYVDPNGLGSRQWKEPYVNEVNPTVSFMSRLPRVNTPGNQFVYSSADTDLAGIVVSNAVRKSLSEYLSDRLWQLFGMESEAYWIVDAAGHERGGSGISMRLRDQARVGLFVLEGGAAGGEQILPPAWLEQATSKLVSSSEGSGYGYFWWLYKHGFAARGHAGQAIYIYPREKVVIAISSAWLEDAQPNRPDYWKMCETFCEAMRVTAAAYSDTRFRAV